MNQNEIPIIIKIYDLYKIAYQFRLSVPRLDRYALWQKCENSILEILEIAYQAGYKPRVEKQALLEKAALKINLLKILIRLAKEIKAIDEKKYAILQEKLEEIGRMAGGWLRMLKSS